MSISEIYSILVLKHHIPPKYVLDEMEMYEVRALLDYEYYSHKDDWEQARLIAYLIAQVNSRKTLRLKDITEFYWEKERGEEGDTSISREDIERLKNKAQAYLEKINGRSSN